MPKQRLQVQGPGPVTFRPGTAPVDTFVQPTEGRKLARLAEGLSTIAPSLSRFSDTLASHKAASEKARGEAEIRLAIEQARAEGKTYQEAIKAGAIRPDQSPWFRVGAMETLGRSAVEKYRGDLIQSAREEGLDQLMDVAEFDQFESEFRAKWMEQNVGDIRGDSHFENAFGRQADAYISQMRGNYAEQAGGNLVKNAGEALHTRTASIILDAHSGDISSDATARVLQLDLDRAVASGMPARLANEAIVRAVVNAAKQANDPSLLGVLDHLTTDKASGGTLGLTSYAMEAREAAEQEIMQQTHSEWTRAAQRQEQERKEVSEGIFTEFAAAVIEDPTGVEVEPYAQKLIEAGDFAGAAQLYNYRAGIAQGQNFADEGALEGFTVDVWNGRLGAQGIIGLLTNGQVDRAGFTYLMNQHEEIKRQRGGSGSRNNDPAFLNDAWQSGSRTLWTMFGAEGTLNHEAAVRRERGVYAAERAWWDWFHREGQGASYLAQRQKMAEIVEQVRTEFSASPQDASGVPGNPLGEPQRPRWEQERVATPGTIRDLDGWTQRGRSFTPAQFDFLRRQGVDPADPTAVQRFIATQKGFINR